MRLPLRGSARRRGSPRPSTLGGKRGGRKAKGGLAVLFRGTKKYNECRRETNGTLFGRLTSLPCDKGNTFQALPTSGHDDPAMPLLFSASPSPFVRLGKISNATKCSLFRLPPPPLPPPKAREAIKFMVRLSQQCAAAPPFSIFILTLWK